MSVCVLTSRAEKVYVRIIYNGFTHLFSRTLRCTDEIRPMTSLTSPTLFVSEAARCDPSTIFCEWRECGGDPWGRSTAHASPLAWLVAQSVDSMALFQYLGSVVVSAFAPLLIVPLTLIVLEWPRGRFAARTVISDRV